MAKGSNGKTGSSGKSSGGGGINTRQHVRTPIKSGPPSTQKVSVEAVAGLGNKRGNHFMGGSTPVNKAARPTLIEKNVPQVPSGNAVALNVGKGGPGAGRVVHPCGTQGTQGPVNPGGAPLTPTPSGGPGGFGFTGSGKVVR